MLRIICIGLMALPAYLYNAEPSVASSSDVPIPTTTFINQIYSINTQTNLAPWLFSSREDQTGECLRHGGCRY